MQGGIRLLYVHTYLEKKFKYWFKNYVELHPWLNQVTTSREKKASSPFLNKNINGCYRSKVMISEFHYSYKNTQWHSYYFILKWCQGNIVTIFTQAFTRQNNSLWLFLFPFEHLSNKILLAKMIMLCEIQACTTSTRHPWHGNKVGARQLQPLNACFTQNWLLVKKGISSCWML